MGQIVQVADGWKSSSPGRYRHDAGGRLINAYAEQASPSGKMQYPIYPFEGLSSLATLNGSVFRGGIDLTDTVGYTVSGTQVDKVTVTWSSGSPSATVSNIGTFPGSKPVFMARNRKASTPQIAIAGEGNRYILEDDTLTTIADADLPSDINSVAFMGGYFAFTRPNGQFFITSIDEGTAVDALDFATNEANPDGTLAVHAVRQELAFFGKKSIEFWAQTGATFPFERIRGSTINKLGLLCQFSVADLNDVIFFVASDGTVRRINGYSPERVSTEDVERSIASIVDKSTITATAYSFRGHQWYVISAPSWTWAYNAKTGLWSERESHTETRWRGEGHVEINGVHLIGDFEDASLYWVDADTYTEAGTHLIMKLRTPPIHAYPHPLGFDRLYVDPIPGKGLNSSDSHLSNPKLMMRYSDDGGNTWSNERTAAIGQIGEHKKRTKFERLGQSLEDGRIFELAVSAAVIRGITGTAVDVELLDA